MAIVNTLDGRYYDLDPDMLALGFSMLAAHAVAMGDVLTPQELADVQAFLQTLK